MNKYYKLTNLLILIALVFTSFFIWKGRTDFPTPPLKIVTAEGNAEQLKNLELYGYLSNQEIYGNDESFYFKDNEATYLADQSLSRRLDHSLAPLSNELIENHRSFMRGKYPSSKNYLITDDLIIYVAKTTDSYWNEENMNELTIAVLDKDTEQEKEFTVPINGMNYYDLYTSHFDYPKISLVLSTYLSDEINGQAKHGVYEFDLENPDAGLVEVYDFTEKIAKDEYHRVEEVADRMSRFIPIRTMQDIDNEEVEMMTEGTGYFVYDIKENKIIDIPSFETDTLLLTDQEEIYVAEDSGQSLHFYEMNLDTEELEELGEVQLNSASIGRQDDLYAYDLSFTSNITVFDGKLYAFEKQEVNESYLPVFQIVDLNNQETLFLGRIDRLEDSTDTAIDLGVTNYRFIK